MLSTTARPHEIAPKDEISNLNSLKMVWAEEKSITYQLVDGVEKCVIEMMDEEVREMLEDSGVQHKQLMAASKAKMLLTRGD
jgi:hypothetical protein